MTIDYSMLTLIIALVVLGAVFAVSYNLSGNMRKSLCSAGFAYCILALAFFVLLPIRLSSSLIDYTSRIPIGECIMWETGSIAGTLSTLFTGFGFSLFGGMLHKKIRNPLVDGCVWIVVAAAYIGDTFIMNNVWHDYVKAASIVDMTVLAAGMSAGCAMSYYLIKANPELANKINSVRSGNDKKELYRDMSDIYKWEI